MLTLARGSHGTTSHLVTVECPVQRAWGGNGSRAERRAWELRDMAGWLQGRLVRRVGSWRNCKGKLRKKDLRVVTDWEAEAAVLKGESERK